MSMTRECGNNNNKKVSIASSMATATPMTVIGTTAEVMDWHNSSDDNGDSNSDSDSEALAATMGRRQGDMHGQCHGGTTSMTTTRGGWTHVQAGTQ